MPSSYRPKKQFQNIKRILKRSERASKFLPTASLYNIEQTVKRYGKWAMPRGKIPERMFWRGFEQKGVFMEFPTQQQIFSIIKKGAKAPIKKISRKKRR